MNQLIIVLDTAGKGGKTKYRPYICFWAAFWYCPEIQKTETSEKININDRYEVDILHKGIKPAPVRSGASYSSYIGPNKIFYDGIIRALETCYYLIHEDENVQVIVIGDCEPVLKQLNGKMCIKEMKSFYNQVRHYIELYKQKNSDIKFKYIKRDQYSLYEDINRIASEFLSKIINFFEIKGEKNEQ